MLVEALKQHLKYLGYNIITIIITMVPLDFWPQKIGC